MRLAVSFATVGSAFDMESFRLVADRLAAAPFAHYSDMAFGGRPRWPYTPGYIPTIVWASKLADVTGMPFHALISLPAVIADLAIAWIVQSFLGRRGVGERRRLTAAALVVLGPSFAVISGYHGHFDSVAILPAVAALAVWERPGNRRRALAAGLLIGLGGALKTVPLLMVLALLPGARSTREATILLAAAVAVPGLVLLPFLAVDPGGVAHALRYVGVPGAGGLSLVVQPSLSRFWLTDPFVDPSQLTLALVTAGPFLDVLVMVALGALLVRCRFAPLKGAVLVWLAVYVFGTGFFFQYLVWGLPFFIMAGYLGWSGVVQAVALLPTALFYLGPWQERWVVPVYASMMIALWAGFLIALVRLGGSPSTPPPTMGVGDPVRAHAR